MILLALPVSDAASVGNVNAMAKWSKMAKEKNLTLGVEIFGPSTLDWLMRNRIELVSNALPPDLGWSIDQHVSYDGRVMIIATQARTAQAFALSGDDGNVEVSLLKEDKLSLLGRFSSIELALNVVKANVSVTV